MLRGLAKVTRCSRAATLLAICALLTSSCEQKATITSPDVDEVLTKAVVAAQKKFPSKYCLGPALLQTGIIRPRPYYPDGWFAAPQTPGTFMRVIAVPTASIMPQQALKAFTSHAAAPCQNQLDFEMPVFFEVKHGGAVTIMSVIDFADTCPDCGSGYAISAVKTRAGWEIELPGIMNTWIS